MRLVDADALKDHLEDLRSYTKLGEEHPYYDGETNALSVAIQSIDNAPTVDAVPVKHGYWTNARTMEHDGEWYCSACGYEPTVFENTLYCSNCGAKMDGEKVSE